MSTTQSETRGESDRRKPGRDPDRCDQCQQQLLEDQEWCLSCGGSRTLIHRPPDWRVPVAVVTLVLAVALGALAFGVSHLTSGANQAAIRAGAAPAGSAHPVPLAPRSQTRRPAKSRRPVATSTPSRTSAITTGPGTTTPSPTSTGAGATRAPVTGTASPTTGATGAGSTTGITGPGNGTGTTGAGNATGTPGAGGATGTTGAP